MSAREWKIVNPGGSRRVVHTRELLGDRRRQLLAAADRRTQESRSIVILSATLCGERAVDDDDVAVFFRADYLGLARFARQSPPKEGQQ